MKRNLESFMNIKRNLIRFCLSCAVLLALPSVVQSQFTYTTNNGAITITGYTGPGGAVTIPSTITGLPVTTIGTSAFFNNFALTSVTIPNSVTSIGVSAFDSCYNLSSITIGNSVASIGDSAFEYDGMTSVTIPNSVTSIGHNAFWGCESLTTVTIPASVTSIGDVAFGDNYRLTAITVDTSNPAYSSVAGVLFNKSQTTLIQYPPGNVGTSYTIPNSVSSIGDGAFVACANLTAIMVDSGNLFYCSVSGVLFDQSQTMLIQYPEGKVSTSYTIPNSVTTIGNEAFFYCYSLTSVTIGTNVTSIGFEAFIYCYGLTTVTIPNSVTTIGYDAFFGCDYLTSVTIGSSVTNIGFYAFAYCSVTSVYFQGNSPSPTNDTTVFSGDNSATAYYLPGAIGWGATFDGIPTVSLFNCTTNNGGITITGYNGLGGAVSIPSTISGLPVTSIGVDAFYKNQSITSVTIPDSVTNIGIGAFFSCTSLATITIGTNVTSIGKFAFEDCLSLTSITIPASVTSIASAAFSGCTNLASVIFQGNAPSTGSTIFYNDSNVTIYYPPGATGWGSTFGGIPTSSVPYTYVTNNAAITITGYVGAGGAVAIPSAINGLPVTMLANDSFYTNQTITSITIPDNVTNIGAAAFAGCLNLTNVTMGANLVSIGAQAFQFSKLASVTIPNNVTSIGDEAFNFCESLTSVTMGYNVTSIGTNAFYECLNLPSITIPDSVTNIGTAAFAGCFNLTSVTLGANLVSIGAQAFQLTRLASVTIPNNVTSIGDEAFNFCESLTSVTIGTNVISIGTNVFYQCLNLTSVTIPNSVTSIGDQSFENCYALTNITLSTNLTSIGNGEFGSSALISVAIPNSATNIGNQAFSYCASLTNVLIGTNVTSIGTNAFYQCLGLNSLTIPNSITNINAYAFYGCTNLASVTMGTNVSFVGFAFANCFGLTGVNFIGNAPVTANNTNVFSGDTNGIAYYLPGTTGWAATFDGLSTILIVPYTYTTNNGAITITAYTGSGGAVVIPSLINGLPVTGIGYGTFLTNQNVTSITIPNSVTNIGADAFDGNVNLTAVTIGTNVVNIGDYAFENCTNLTSVTIPNSVTNIGNFAFYDCSEITGVTIGTNVTSIGMEAFGFCFSLTSVTIPSSVTNIGFVVFYADTSLNTITVSSNNSTYISVVGVLFNKSQTTLIEYPAGKVGTSYTISASVNNIGGYAFDSCANLTSVTIGTNVTSIAGGAFQQCINITNIAIPNSITVIGYDTFQLCFGLTSVTIGTNVTSIEEAAFNDCTSLTSVTIPNSVTSIGQQAFGGCQNLSSIIVPNSITNIGNYAFSYCFNLTGMYFQGNSPTPTNDATVFSGDNNATAYYLPGPTGWGATFDGIPATLYLPYTYTTNNNGAITLTGYTGSGGTVVIPDTIYGLKVTVISGTFFNNTNLTSVTIGTNVTTIQQFAFAGCTSLTNVNFLGNAPGTDLTVFSGDNNATAYYLPGATGWSSTFDGIPAVLLNPPTPHVPTTDGSFGVKTNLFGFDITGTNNQTVVVLATTNLAGNVWTPIQTNIISGNAVYFSDPQWTNYHTRFYRVRSP